MGEFDETIGFTLMGIFVNTYLFGVVMSQFSTYWNAKFKDPLWATSVLALLAVLNVSQAATVIYMGWFYCVTNFNNPSVVATSLWPYPFTALTTATIALINHIFQSYRIFVFTRSKLLVGVILVFALTTCGIGVAAAIQSWIFSELEKLAALESVVTANLSLQATVDVAISIILSYSFSKSKTTFKRTDRVLNRLIRGAVQSGLFTSIFALGTLFSFRFSPGTYMLALFAIPIGRIYTHTLMDHLISREELRTILTNGQSFITVPDFNTSRARSADSIALGSTSTNMKVSEV